MVAWDSVQQDFPTCEYVKLLIELSSKVLQQWTYTQIWIDLKTRNDEGQSQQQ